MSHAAAQRPDSGAHQGQAVPALADLATALGVLALGVFFLVGSFSSEVNPGYARVGPRFFPLLVAGGLLVTGGLLTLATLRGARAEPAAEEDADPDAPTDWRAMGWISLGVLLDIALMPPLGFVLASTALFWCVARGFHSKSPLRDLAIAVALSVIVYLLFTRGLGLSLPPGVLKGLL